MPEKTQRAPTDSKNTSDAPKTTYNIWALLWPYRFQIAILIVCALIASASSLAIPKMIASNIDSFSAGTFDLQQAWPIFIGITVVILIATYLQSLVQTYASEQVGKDLRQKLITKISRQSYSYVQTTTSATLLTNLTSDVDAIKMFVAQAIVAIVTSVFTIVGATVLLLRIDWQLALAVLAILPMIGGVFMFIFGKVREKFLAAQKILDALNRVINESIVGSMLVRVLNSQSLEYQKFVQANTDARNLGLQILSLFAALIPVVGFLSNMASLLILVMGGHFVITGQMTLGDFTAFNSYLGLLIFPIFILGFMSSVIARATASYQRIGDVLFAKEPQEAGKVTTPIKGNLDVKNVSLQYDKKTVLKDISLSIKAGSKVAIIGATGEGKTQLLYLLTGLMPPTSGSVLYDGKNIQEYDQVHLHTEIGLVFQDSNMFNLSLRENIAFNTTVTNEELEKAIETSELKNFIEKLPQGLDTTVSERGTSLSGGQKQRIMLARALALNPKVLFLDDFTARVDPATEQRIVASLEKNYPDLTLISVTQKISSIKEYDQIILLMDGEVLAHGKHKDLLKTSTEYAQIYSSQKSTSHYELLTD